MEIVFEALADAANIANEGKLNLLGIFQGVAAPSLPIQIISMSLALIVQAREEEINKTHSLKITFLDQDGTELNDFPDTTFTLSKNANPDLGTLTIVLNVQGLALDKYGTYYFNVIIDGDSLKHIPMKVFLPIST